MDRYAVIGNPVEHSLSPTIHLEFARQVGHSINYEKILAPIGRFYQTLCRFRDEGGQGTNVTLPFKSEAFNCMDELSDRARLAGAVNTVIMQDKILKGDNTDGAGFINDVVQRLKWQLNDKRILLLGAGGAVKGILAPLLLQKPHSVIIANRTQSKAAELAANFSSLGKITVLSLEALSHEKFDFIINGTSLGINHSDFPIWQNLKVFSNESCYDLIYSKQLTPFLAWAKQQGCQHLADGLGMLVAQAAESFYLWRGIYPQIEPVYQRLVDKMKG